MVYRSPARVILSGLGADELLGGYSRHRTAFKQGGWLALLNELQLDVDRIHTRNLGRDDRVISDHGKETRYPYLSLDLISHLSNIPVHLKVDPRLVPSPGTQPLTATPFAVQGLPGDKLLQRLAARELGLFEVAGRAKRAIQFGTRSAKMEEGTKRVRGDMQLRDGE